MKVELIHDTCKHKLQQLYPFYIQREIVFLSFIM
jgi:hypothetical protein